MAKESSEDNHHIFINTDERLRDKAAAIIESRKHNSLEKLVGGLQCIIINTEYERQKLAITELLSYTGFRYHTAFENDDIRACILKVDNSADIMLTSRKKTMNHFLPFNQFPKSRNLPNTRLETFVFEVCDLRKYVEIQKSLGIAFLTDDVIEADGFIFIQTAPSKFTGNSIGFIEWKGSKGVYSAFAGTKTLDWRFDKPVRKYLGNISYLDHAATRVRAEDRDPAILEFMSLTSYNFQFAIFVKELNSITNVARLDGEKFALVFTSGVSPYVNDDISGPTEKYVHNYGPRVHHLAFHTESIENAFDALRQDGMEFLVNLVGSPEEGLKQTFSIASPNTMIVNEYIHRYGGFDGFFTKSNVAILTEATGKQ
jgi:hypothetical protein